MPAPQFPQINNGDSGLTVRTTLNQVIDTFGVDSTSSGSYSHAEGELTQAIGPYSHAEGSTTQATGYASHAEGYQTITVGDYSHAEGYQTIASGSYQHVSGQYNTHGDNTSLFIIGNGTADNARSDVFRVSGSTVQVTGSLNVTGSQVYLTTDDFRVTSPYSGLDLVTADGIGNGVVIYGISGDLAADIQNRSLHDTNTSQSIDWEQRNLVDTTELTSIDWNNRELIDATLVASVLWNTRILAKSDTTVAFNWENGQMTGSLDISGSVTISDVLTLAPQDPLPSGTPTGSFAVSASVPPKPYFWDGSAWNALY